MSNSFLSQEEIDALLTQNQVSETNKAGDNLSTLLTDEEKDALGEIGNISMGSAATALSQLLNKRVSITTPRVSIENKNEFLNKFATPFVLISVEYTVGLKGASLLIIKITDAAIIADLMMGGDGTNPSTEISEIALSAVGEAMNQMIGSSATSMAQIFNKSVNISPPTINKVLLAEEQLKPPFDEEQLVLVAFDLEIEGLINSEIMQILPVGVARDEVNLLFSVSKSQESNNQQDSEQPETQKPVATKPGQELHETQQEQVVADFSNLGIRNIDLILDIPLQVSVLLGKAKKPLKEVLSLYPGSIVELEKLANESVDILINGTLIAKGEVVVINENFGVKITNIISPMERVNYLR